MDAINFLMDLARRAANYTDLFFQNYTFKREFAKGKAGQQQKKKEKMLNMLDATQRLSEELLDSLKVSGVTCAAARWAILPSRFIFRKGAQCADDEQKKGGILCIADGNS